VFPSVLICAIAALPSIKMLPLVLVPIYDLSCIWALSSQVFPPSPLLCSCRETRKAKNAERKRTTVFLFAQYRAQTLTDDGTSSIASALLLVRSMVQSFGLRLGAGRPLDSIPRHIKFCHLILSTAALHRIASPQPSSAIPTQIGPLQMDTKPCRFSREG